jgi:hypothetical protein
VQSESWVGRAWGALHGGVRRPALLAPICSVAFLLAASAAAADAAEPPAGKLSVQVVGLPKGESGSFILRGGGEGVHRRYRVIGHRVLAGLPPGRYRVTAQPVRIARRHGTIERGARGLPTDRRSTVRVRRGGVAKLGIRYGSIINPGVRAVSGEVTAITGDPANPTTATLTRAADIRKGSILSARPSSLLPHGLLARVTGIERDGDGTVASLTPASIYEVAPNMSFDIPVQGEPQARIQALSCSGTSGFSPYVHLSDIHLSGGWSTSKVAFIDVTTGATVEAHFKVTPGVSVDASAGLSCSLPLPGVSVQGMAGPIPVYGSLRPKASAELSTGAKMRAEGSTDVTVGANFSPGGVRPILGFGSPKFSFSAELFAGLKAAVGVRAELGVGVAQIGNLHLALDNTLDFSATPGRCSWDLNLGSFSAGGKLGPLTLSSPSTPPLYHRNLWSRSCGGPSAPTAPAPKTPTGPPAPQLPLVRATMDWYGESDVDLYAWDEYGNVAYYIDKDGIPGAELITDVIPDDGEFEHSAEYFQEIADPNRRYTFGICEFNGEGSEVTLHVTDPGGSVRTFHHTLYGNGDWEVITTSPDGEGYDPGYDWCNYL